ncbi:uncharacterized protein LOC129587335 [Paramacrobiotus metropolitanus]|uniref:uncharacterized protein LOC129587335 n=1 Tax=Paramacrobiotus metropolitanus TaxID=2943436 RepID=UPI00244591E0|nr:uncharacterized protein LOC129587335 [Paramacrobiotus metropolitanus]
MREHLAKYHRKYYAAVTDALVAADSEEDDPQLVQKHETFMRRTRRLFFPGWTRRKEELFPSQIIPDKVVIPTKISKEGEIQYICNIDPCSKRTFRPPHAASGVHTHVWTEHRSRLDMRTSLYHKCPAPKCREIVLGCEHQMEPHVKAVHPELLPPFARQEYSEAAKKKRKDLEDSIPTACIGAALANDQQDDDDSQLFLQCYSCPVAACEKMFMGDSARKYMVWHLGADHEADWNVQETPVA